MANVCRKAYTKDMKQRRGFTLVEITVVVAIIAILTAITTMYLYRRRSESKLARVSTELNNLAAALTLYVQDNNGVYPPDVSRAIPPGLETYLDAGSWPVSIWPNGVFDYDNWTHPGPGANQGKQIYQISYRLCNINDPIATCSDPVIFPNFTRYSSIFLLHPRALCAAPRLHYRSRLLRKL
jgi:prepilin-type N-terminal cleavage/methylation domain-containing protein